jgi:hypothetical protein
MYWPNPWRTHPRMSGTPQKASPLLSSPLLCGTQWEHSCVERAHSRVRDMFHCFLARFPLQSERPGLRPDQKRQEQVPFLAHLSLRRKPMVKNESDTPPRSGWLDELDRLNGGWSAGLGVARCAPYWLVQNGPAPSTASCSRMYVRTCSSSNPTVDRA